jgi:hypothetical protein
MLLAIDASRVRVLQYPALRAAFRGIEKMAFSKYFEEDLLHDIFSLTRIPHYPQGDAQHSPIVAPEECVHGFMISGLKVRDQILITQAAKGASSERRIMSRTCDQR